MVRNISKAFAIALMYFSGEGKAGCKFAQRYDCADFSNPLLVNEYLNEVMKWEGQFAQPGVGYDAISGYTYDGHPLDYATGALYGSTPHKFSAPSKESIHLSILALAVSGNEHALTFCGGKEAALKLLEKKISGYENFNRTYPGFGCFTPWVSFNSETGGIEPAWDWPNRVPGLDNGEWFWALFATSVALDKAGESNAALAERYKAYVQCQRDNAKTIFYRGDGKVSAVVTIADTSVPPEIAGPAGYSHEGSGLDPWPEGGYLNDPYEGETMTQLLYLFAEFDTEAEREQLWVMKRDLFQAVNYTIPESANTASKVEVGSVVTVQKGWWFSTHEQWKMMLLPYVSRNDDLPLVRKLYRNAEVVRTWDAVSSGLPGMMASINDVTSGGEDIPDYISATGIGAVAFEEVLRRDVLTPYSSFGLMLTDRAVGLCWYNNMLQAPRMQGPYGSTEAINVNGTEISPLVTWDSKITTVLAMLGGVSNLVEDGLNSIYAIASLDSLSEQREIAYAKFVQVVQREYELVFGPSSAELPGENIPLLRPNAAVPIDGLSGWDLNCDQQHFLQESIL